MNGEKYFKLKNGQVFKTAGEKYGIVFEADGVFALTSQPWGLVTGKDLTDGTIGVYVENKTHLGIVEIFEGYSNSPYHFAAIVEIYQTGTVKNKSLLGKSMWKRPDPVVELTIQDIADKFQIPVSRVRIKDYK